MKATTRVCAIILVALPSLVCSLRMRSVLCLSYQWCPYIEASDVHEECEMDYCHLPRTRHHHLHHPSDRVQWSRSTEVPQVNDCIQRTSITHLRIHPLSSDDSSADSRTRPHPLLWRASATTTAAFGRVYPTGRLSRQTCFSDC